VDICILKKYSFKTECFTCFTWTPSLPHSSQKGIKSENLNVVAAYSWPGKVTGMPPTGSQMLGMEVLD